MGYYDVPETDPHGDAWAARIRAEHDRLGAACPCGNGKGKAVSTLLHDPVPDGQTGPFLRKPHRKLGDATGVDAGYAYDERCARCVFEHDQAIHADLLAAAHLAADILEKGYGLVVEPWLGGLQFTPVSGSDRPWWETRPDNGYDV